MLLKKWVVGTPDRARAKQLAEECDIDPFTALIACGRGYNDAAELEQLLSDEPILSDPHELADIEKAAACVNKAIEAGELIAVYGDYDCDGVTATALMVDYLSSRGAKVVPYIPHRTQEGYGMNTDAIDQLYGMGVTLIITVDNGISSAAEISYAGNLGIRTVVTDHHIPPAELPPAEAVVDPHRVDCPSAFKEICGVMVAFKLVCVIDDKEPEQMLGRYADLVTVGTVADVMPLINENRCMVREGIRSIRRNPRTGISALLNVSGIERDKLTAGRIAFGIVPRINAAGRMGDAERALQLLSESDMLRALEIANEIDAQNTNRQQVEKDIAAKASAMIENKGYCYGRVIVIAGEGWHPGVAGIVASRITEKYGKPTFVLCIEGEVAHGSGRSYAGFSLYNAMQACSDLLLKFGGHELAGGLSIATENIDAMRKCVNEYAAHFTYVAPELRLDFRLNPTGLSVEMADAIKTLEPFGTGNPTPVFGIFGVKLEKINPISSGKHLKLLFSRNNSVFQAMLFGVTPERFCFCPGDNLDLAVTLETSFYQDKYTLSVLIRAIRMSEIDDECLFAQLQAYHDYCCGLEVDKATLVPTREEVGAVYKQIIKESVSVERLEYIFLTKIGYAKTAIAVTVLTELGLITQKSGKLCAVSGAPKTDLMKSVTYQSLRETGVRA